jgi:hypothetical protein
MNLTFWFLKSGLGSVDVCPPHGPEAISYQAGITEAIKSYKY